ncbi:uncharacterized protein LOC143203860 [Rhynchophorus ferrugineus]|uniref:uncharacterized protein LOC143203860 n=1 Tax=Rhynchophorus ferrugineus TaxID=354439 RepID=UPI003FCE4AAB
MIYCIEIIKQYLLTFFTFATRQGTYAPNIKCNIKSHKFFEADRYIGDSSTTTRPGNKLSLSHRFRSRLDEKLIALSLLKCSGRGYKLLSKIFCLPSRRTLMQILNALVHKLDCIDRTAVVIFDKMYLNLKDVQKMKKIHIITEIILSWKTQVKYVN